MRKKVHYITLYGFFLSYALTILTKSYFQSGGYLTNDSTHYLALARNLLDGKGYYTLSLLEQEKVGSLVSQLMISFLYNGPYSTYKLMKSGNLSYHETVAYVMERYEFLPPKSIIAFGNRHL